MLLSANTILCCSWWWYMMVLGVPVSLYVLHHYISQKVLQQNEFVKKKKRRKKRSHRIGAMKLNPDDSAIVSVEGSHRMRFLIVGCGPMGRYITGILLHQGHQVTCINRRDEHFIESRQVNNCTHYCLDELDRISDTTCDVIILAISIPSLENVLTHLPVSAFENSLVVDICSIKVLF